jgi:1,4-alpha-glucan branching enzyme
MNDTLRYMRRRPGASPLAPRLLTFGLVYAFSENYLLPISHDEVVHGKARCSARCRATTGSASPTCAPTTASCGAIRARSCCSWARSSPSPTSGTTTRTALAPARRPAPRRRAALVRDLNRLYRERPALHRRDCEAAGLPGWIDDRAERSVLAWRAFDGAGGWSIVVCNFTPVPRHGYLLGLPPARRAGARRSTAIRGITAAATSAMARAARSVDVDSEASAAALR